LEIATVGNPAVGTSFDVVGSNTSTTDTSGTFASFQFGSHSYTVSYVAPGVTATVSS
jgi:hypothetical protein